MSDSIRVAVVAEGRTDVLVIEAILRAALDDVVVTRLQPEGSIAFGQVGSGWGGVYRWCKQAKARGGGRLASDSLVLESFDLLIVHIDADVAARRYADDEITPERSDGVLPCDRPCPPAADACDALRAVLLGWCGETAAPDKVVLCVPSRSMEAWVVAALFANDKEARRACFECYATPENRLSQQPKKVRIRKSQADYQSRFDELASAWPRIAAQTGLSQARRFDLELASAMARRTGE